MAHGLLTSIIIAIFTREEELSPSTTSLALAPHFFFVSWLFFPNFSLAERSTL